MDSYAEFVAETVAEWEDRFDKTKKVIVISPPRNASTLLAMLLNINPRFMIFCESCLNLTFAKTNRHLDRVRAYSKLDKINVACIYDLFERGDISFKDFYITMTSGNKKMCDNIQNGCVIGDKNPISGSSHMDFIKWAVSEPNFFFQCIIKDDLELTAKSIYTYTKPRIKRDIHKMFNLLCDKLTGLLIYASELKSLLLKDENFKSRLFLYKFSDFVSKPEPYINHLFSKIDGSHPFNIDHYDVDVYSSRIEEVLCCEYYGFTDHVLKKSNELKNHQTGLRKNICIENTSVNAHNVGCIERVKLETDIFKKWNALMADFPFLREEDI